MIGIVVVTHGRVAEELVSAAQRIVGDIPAIAAVSIGWGEDSAAAGVAAIEKGLDEVGRGEALILTDMFGGTPTNLSLAHLSSEVEIVTGVNLPMIIKATSQREGVLPHVAREIRDQGKDAIYVASEVLENKS
jgi:PTS system mannose-specific IIA component